MTYGKDLFKNGKVLSVACFGLFAGWLLSVPFEGQTLYLLAARMGFLDLGRLMIAVLFLHFAGLALCGLFIHTQKRAKTAMLIATIGCMAGTLALISASWILWCIGLAFSAFLAGVVVACWSFWMKSEVPQSERFPTVAIVLLLSNGFMLLVNLTAASLSPYIAFGVAVFLLSASLLLCRRLPVKEMQPSSTEEIRFRWSIRNPLFIFALFIAILTINSGIMYSVITPAFQQYTLLVSWYWALPYIAVLVAVKNRMKTENRYNILMVSIAMIGVSYVLFSMLDRSPVSYIIINTLQMAAFGMCDLFWWGTLAEMLDLTENPPKVFGTGLAANVFGILLGRLVINGIYSLDSEAISTTSIAMLIVLFVIVAIPLLYKRLSSILEKHKEALDAHLSSQVQKQLMFAFSAKPQEPRVLPKELSAREREIVERLLQGKTYKVISEELYVSENTIKYYIKSIYSKLGIHNKSELIRMLQEKREEKREEQSIHK